MGNIHLTLLVLACGLVWGALANTYEKYTYVYKQVDGLSIEVDVFRPLHSSTKKSPVVLGFHAGGFFVGNRTEAYSPRQLAEMLSRGWIVVSADYRLAPAVTLFDIVEDAKDAYAWIRSTLVRKIPNLDVDHICMFGHSAGGGLALIAGYSFEPRPAAIIAFYPGLPDFTVFYNPTAKLSSELTTERDHLAQERITQTCAYPYDTTNRRWAFVLDVVIAGLYPLSLFTKDMSETAETLSPKVRALSPLFHIDARFPPTYISHGMGDALINPELQTLLLQQLLHFNVPAVLDLVPGALHLFDLLSDSDNYWNHISKAFDFAAPYLTPRGAITMMPNVTYNSVVSQWAY